MDTLLDDWHQLMHIYSSITGPKEPPDFVEKDGAKAHAVAQSEHRFIERMTFSSYEEIVAVIDSVYQNPEQFLEFPVWMRNLAFRLACLQQPHNANIRRRAAIDLRHFRPDWNVIADGLEREAQRIEAQ